MQCHDRALTVPLSRQGDTAHAVQQGHRGHRPQRPGPLQLRLGSESCAIDVAREQLTFGPPGARLEGLSVAPQRFGLLRRL